jgi:hypothetical protein
MRLKQFPHALKIPVDRTGAKKRCMFFLSAEPLCTERLILSGVLSRFTDPRT